MSIFWCWDKKANHVFSTSDSTVWCRYFMDRQVGNTKIGNITISTVFLGLDHNVDGTPILWETMIFGLNEEYQERYTSYDDAVKGHQRAKIYVYEQLNKIKRLKQEQPEIINFR